MKTPHPWGLWDMGTLVLACNFRRRTCGRRAVLGMGLTSPGTDLRAFGNVGHRKQFSPGTREPADGGS